MLSHAITVIFGAAGGGSSSFGGGGFSGGGGYGGGGYSGGYSGGGGFSGGGGYGSGGVGVPISISPGFLLFIFLMFALFFVFTTVVTRMAVRKRARRYSARDTEARRAAAVAVEEDASFDADTLVATASQLFIDIQNAWDQRDLGRLSQLAAPDLLVEWERRLADLDAKGWHNRVELTGPPKVNLVSFKNAADDADDRATFFIESELADYVVTRSGQQILRNGETDPYTTNSEYWTLEKAGAGWRLASIEQEGEGDHHLTSDFVTAPWEDTEGLRDQAIAEQATADALPASYSPGELADLDFDGAARSQAQDLALVDGRFDPDFIAASVRRVIDAWTVAVDGEDSPLEAASTPEAFGDLLYPGDPTRKTRLVVRGPDEQDAAITALRADAQPPQIDVEFNVRGYRYIEDRDTYGVLYGSREREDRWTERWTLILSGDGEWPWKIARATSR